jgi:hypothetical protein
MTWALPVVFCNADGTNRRYDEMWTANWWWDMQVGRQVYSEHCILICILQMRLPKGATIAPLIIAADKTQLSRFSGDKYAWPVYLTIGNISKAIRRKPSSGATVLIGYLPVTKLDGLFQRTEETSEARWRLYHQCMRTILESTKAAGERGVEMLCPDGLVRLLFLILAAIVADFEEQVLIACVKNNRCPKCLARLDELGDLKTSAPRNPKEMATLFEWMADHPGIMPDKFEQDGLRPAYQPFWADLPHCDALQAITPDLLHQLHNGVITHYVVPWCQSLADPGELDQRLIKSPTRPAQEMRYFSKGISQISQWSGCESKEVEKQFVGTLPGAVPARAVRCATAANDFVHLASYQSQTDLTLADLDKALASFHDTKDVFLELRDAFNIPKIHSMVHYSPMIRLLGSADGYNTEAPERLHIDIAKDAYNSTNKRDFVVQMTVHLRRKEALIKFDDFRAWRAGQAVQNRPDKASKGETTAEPEPKEAEVTVRPRGEHTALPARLSSANEPQSCPPPRRPYLIAKHAPHPRTRIDDAQRRHSAPRLAHALRQYLRSPHPISLDSRINIFNRIRIPLPRIPMLGPFGKEIIESIRATPGSPARSRAAAQPAHLDTVLVRTSEFCRATHGTRLQGVSHCHPSSNLADAVFEGLRVAQLKVIFTFSAQPGSKHNTEPLAYIEWFRPFSLCHPDTKMFQISRSTRDGGQPHGQIVPVRDIYCSCHLQPNFGTAADPAWTSAQVLTQADTFSVNRFTHLFAHRLLS